MIRTLLSTLATLLLLTACSVDQPNTSSPEFPGQVTHELQTVFRTAEPDTGIFINGVRLLRFLSDGSLLFKNGYGGTRLLEMSREGVLQHMIGREGRGPGEFRDITGLAVSPGDSLFVYDRRNARQQVFARTDSGSWSLARAEPFERDADRKLIPEYPLELHPSETHAYRALMQNDISFNDTTSRFYRFIAGVDRDLRLDGEITLLRLSQDAAVYRPGASVSTDWDDDYRRGFYFFRPGGGDVIYLSNTSSEIRRLTPEGESRVTGHLPFEHRPNDLSELRRWTEMVSDSYDPERVDRIRSKFLDIQPYYMDAFLDGSQLWVHFSRSDSTAPDWAVAGLDGEIRAFFHGPENFTPLAVDGGRLYWVLAAGEVEYLASFALRER